MHGRRSCTSADNDFGRKMDAKKKKKGKTPEARSSSRPSINKDTQRQISHFGDLVLGKVLHSKELGKELPEVLKSGMNTDHLIRETHVDRLASTRIQSSGELEVF
jgi:hypothetical protein